MRITETEMQERKKIIIQNTFELFAEYGIANVKIKKIARKSGVSENTIYRYFENKENLVLESFIYIWDSIMRGVEEEVEASEGYFALSGYEQIRIWLRRLQRLYMENRNFILFSYEAKLFLIRNNIKMNAVQQDIMMHAVREPCLAALDKGKKDGSVIAQAESLNLFYAIWGSIRGYIAKVVIYERLYGEDSPWESRYEVMESGILCALRSGWTLQS